MVDGIQPLKLGELLRKVEETCSIGVHVFEIAERPEVIQPAELLMKSFFEYNNGYFYNLIGTDGSLHDVPEVVPFEDAQNVSSSLSLGHDGRQRKFMYAITDDDVDKYGKNSHKATASMLTLEQNNDWTDGGNLSDQRTFAILADVLLIPTIAKAQQQKKVGILFEGYTIDVENWRVLFSYLQSFSLNNDIAIYLFIIQGSARNTEIYSKKVNRAGILYPRTFISTNSFDDCMGIINNLNASVIHSVTKFPTVFFLGAGASIEAGFPSTERIRLDTMMRIMNEDDITKEPEEIDDAFKRFIVQHDRLLIEENETAANINLTFERVMTEELRFCHNAVESPTLNQILELSNATAQSTSHDILAALTKTDYKPIFITTNYDDLIEKSLSANSVSIFVDEDFQEQKVRTVLSQYLYNNGKVPIFKLHGSISDFASIKASVNHTRSLGRNKLAFLCSLCDGSLFSSVIEDAKNPVIRMIFIGYGFGDYDINHALEDVFNRAHGVHPLAVTPYPSTKTITFLSKANRRSITPDIRNNLISIPFNLFTKRITELLPH